MIRKGSQAANFRAQGTLRRRQIGSKRSKDVPKKKNPTTAWKEKHKK